MENQKFSELINSTQPVLIDFFAEWCGPCKAMKPILEEVKQKMGDKVRVVKIDVDKNQSLAAQLNVNSVPTLMIFKAGKKEWQKIGVSRVNELEAAITNLL